MYNTLHDNTDTWYDSLNDCHNHFGDDKHSSKWCRYVYTYIGAINEFEGGHDYA